jgi:hypothetical protein
MAGARFPARKRFFLLRNFQTGSGAYLASYPVGTGALNQRVKRQLREAEHSPPSSVEVKNTGSISPLSHTSSWRDA